MRVDGHIDVDSIVTQQDWDEERDMFKHGMDPVLDEGLTAPSMEEIINESY